MWSKYTETIQNVTKEVQKEQQGILQVFIEIDTAGHWWLISQEIFIMLQEVFPIFIVHNAKISKMGKP